MTSDVLTSFLDGFSLAGLFTRLRRRGAPTRAFASPTLATKTETWREWGTQSFIPRGSVDD